MFGSGWFLNLLLPPEIEETISEKVSRIEQSISNDEIIFAGSSIIEYWKTLKSDFSPLPVHNHGISRSLSSTGLEYINEITLIHKPKIIVYYYGSNDSFMWSSTTDTLSFQTQYLHTICKMLPGTVVIFMSLIRAPRKNYQRDFIDNVNKGLQELCNANKERTIYFDANIPLEIDIWKSKNGMFVDDQLHLTPEAYYLLTEALKPILNKLWSTKLFT